MTKTPHSSSVMITGAGGRLGRLLRNSVAAGGAAVFAARRGPADYLFAADSIPDTLPPCDAVIGLWGVTSGDDKALAQNAALVQATCAVARACNAPRVFHLSSAAIYGPGVDLSEEAPPAPANAYGHAKLEMEVRVQQCAPDGLHHCCLRLANVVGADSLAPALRDTGASPVTLTRFADGRGPLRSYISPGHLLQILHGLAALPPEALPQMLNVAASDPVEMQALARAADRPVAWKPETPQDRQVVTLSTERLATLLPGLALRRSAADMIHDWQASETKT